MALNVKILIRTKLPEDTSIDGRSTRLLLKIADEDTAYIAYEAVQWQFYGPLVSTALTPEFDVTTPITTTTPGITSPDIYELNIILAENRKYKLRVRFRNELGIYTGWSDFFEFKSKNYKDFTPFITGNFSREKVVVTQGATLSYDP